MSDTILGGDFTIYYLNEDRQKRIEWTGSATGTRTMNELYSEVAKLLSAATTIDDGTAIKAQTDQEYIIGKFDAGDFNSWFIDRTTVEHLVGTPDLPMSLKSIGWTRVQDTNTGIVKLTLATIGALVQGDIGDTCTHTEGDKGTILDINQDTLEVWIRPLTDGIADSWDATSGTFDADTSTNTSGTTSSASVTGETIWAGIESIGNLQSNTRPFIYADKSEIVAFKGATPDKWWTDGHINLMVIVQDMGVLIDEGYVKVTAHQPGKLYQYWELNLSNGKPKPAPLGTDVEGNDLDGFRQFITTVDTGVWNTGAETGVLIELDGATDTTAVIRSFTGTDPAWTVQYFPLGDLADFSALDVVSEVGTARDLTLSAAAPTNVNGAAIAGVTATFANNNALDIDEDGTNEYFSIVVDCSDEALADVFKFLKYTYRRGNTATDFGDGVANEEYIGTQIYVDYDTLVLTVAEGAVVTQLNTLATGTVVAHHTTPQILVLRATRGTFDETSNIEVDGSNYVTISAGAIRIVNPVTSMPLGTFSGGIFTGAPGVALTNVPAADLNNYVLTDDQAQAISAPLKVAVTVTNTRDGDWIGVFELTDTILNGGIIDKAFDTVGAGAVNQTTLLSTSAIAAQVVGKTLGGTIFHVDDSANFEYRYRFLSWTGSTFTLFQTAARTADAGGTATTLVDASENFVSDGILVGDIIQDADTQEFGYITDVATTTLTITSVGSNNYPSTWASMTNYRVGTTIAINESGVDTYYVPIIHIFETTGSDAAPGNEGASVVYTVDIPAYFVGKQSVGSYKVETFTQEITVGDSGVAPQFIRNSDDIIS